MQLFKKTISLNQAAKISGYAQDYLGYLIRNGEIKGIKKGGIWFTTEADVKSYILKQKNLHKKVPIKTPVIKNSPSLSNTSPSLFARSISVYSLILLVGFSSFGFYLFGKYDNQVRAFVAGSAIKVKHSALASFNNTKSFAKMTANFSYTFSTELANNWIKFNNTLLDSGIDSLSFHKQISLSLADGMVN
ncbi:MAG: helix-turn-helix domain-containing protein, partial [Candidatus Paceibacterota bacterium]